jgi:hypothetical protein
MEAFHATQRPATRRTRTLHLGLLLTLAGAGALAAAGCSPATDAQPGASSRPGVHSADGWYAVAPLATDPTDPASSTDPTSPPEPTSPAGPTTSTPGPSPRELAAAKKRLAALPGIDGAQVAGTTSRPVKILDTIATGKKAFRLRLNPLLDTTVYVACAPEDRLSLDIRNTREPLAASVTCQSHVLTGASAAVRSPSGTLIVDTSPGTAYRILVMQFRDEADGSK